MKLLSPHRLEFNIDSTSFSPAESHIQNYLDRYYETVCLNIQVVQLKTPNSWITHVQENQLFVPNLIVSNYEIEEWLRWLDEDSSEDFSDSFGFSQITGNGQFLKAKTELLTMVGKINGLLCEPLYVPISQSVAKNEQVLFTKVFPIV